MGTEHIIRAIRKEFYDHNPKRGFCYYRGVKYPKKECPVCNKSTKGVKVPKGAEVNG